MGFKENLKSELQFRGLTVKELSALSGIKKQTLDNYLSTHNSTPSAESAVKIAQALNVSVEYLVTGVHPATATENSLQDIEELRQILRPLKPADRTFIKNTAKVMSKEFQARY